MHRFQIFEWLDNLIVDLRYAFFGAFAGSIGYLISVQTYSSISWYKFSVGVLANGFASILTAKVCTALDMPEQWIIVAAGLAGALGYNVTIETLRKYLFKKFGIDRRIDQKIKENNQDVHNNIEEH